MSPWLAWNSRPLLESVGRHLHLHGSRQRWWHQHGAHALDYIAISLSTLLIVVVVAVIWQVIQIRSNRNSQESRTSVWIALIIFAFGGSALVFALELLPDRMADSRRLAPLVEALPGPIYSDDHTYATLAFLSQYHLRTVRSADLLSTPTVTRLLQTRAGCIVINEPELDYLMESRSMTTARVISLLQQRPPGWKVLYQFESATNPLEELMVICSHK